MVGLKNLILTFLPLVILGQDIKPGHDTIKEFHFHPYFNQTDPEEGKVDL